MDTRTVLRMVGLVAVLVCLILLVVGVDSNPGGIATPSDCGSVIAPEKGYDNGRKGGCSGPLDGRLTLSLVVGAVGVAAFFGSTQVKKREDD